MLSFVKSMCLQGLEGVLINVEVDISSGLPYWEIVGLPDTNIRESKDRVKTAIKNSGIELLSRRYIINLSPASVRKNGASLDLAIAIGILISMRVIKYTNLRDTIFIGELSLNGDLVGVNGILAICIEAQKCGIKRIILPKVNAKEASVAEGVEVIGISNLKELIDFLNGKKKISKEKFDRNNIFNNINKLDLDYCDVKGHEISKRVLEIAAAGSHNCLMIGSPGSGKTMMAQRLPSILPALSLDEALEITKIHSIAGSLKDRNIITERPFRAPHHTISEKSLVGGGKNPKPGEVSLAHLGVLLLDELLEFNKNIIEVLRTPMEDKVININRLECKVTYPCNFMTIASMNPCPCGYYGSNIKECACTDSKRKNYISKLSRPLLDRFDLHIQVSSVNYNRKKKKKIEKSIEIRNRVNKARSIQINRYREDGIYFNSDLTASMIEKYCYINNDTFNLLKEYLECKKLSTRSYSKILKVSRTIADLENEENIRKEHVLEAIQYRILDN